MSEIIREAVRIVKELKDVIFVGGVAVALHADKQRYSDDVDFVITRDISNEELRYWL